MLTLIPCPGCGAPAVVTDRFLLPGTGGLAGHLAMRCAVRRYYGMPVDLLSAKGQEQLRSQPPGSRARCAGVVASAHTTDCDRGGAQGQRRHGLAGTGI
jgi:hypothetical protein